MSPGGNCSTVLENTFILFQNHVKHLKENAVKLGCKIVMLPSNNNGRKHSLCLWSVISILSFYKVLYIGDSEHGIPDGRVKWPCLWLWYASLGFLEQRYVLSSLRWKDQV